VESLDLALVSHFSACMAWKKGFYLSGPHTRPVLHLVVHRLSHESAFTFAGHALTVKPFDSSLDIAVYRCKD